MSGGSILWSGMKDAGNVVRLSDFPPTGASTGRGDSAKSRGQLIPFPVSRRFAHSAYRPPERVVLGAAEPRSTGLSNFLEQLREAGAEAATAAVILAIITPSLICAAMLIRFVWRHWL